MIALLLIAIIATDLAVAVLFFTMRRGGAAPAEGGLDVAVAAELEALVTELRAQVQQAAGEIGRQKAQLRRMLTDMEAQAHAQAQAQQTAGLQAVPAPAPITRRDILGMAAEGLTFRAIAGRTGLSVEEVRLMLAMEEDAA